MKRLIEESRKMIRIRSITADGNEEIANYVGALMQDRGLKVQTQLVTHSLDSVSKRQFNVIGVLGDPLVDKKTRKGLLLNTHLDTVGPGLSENWTETGGDPFAATLKEGKIFGLGAADVKLDFLCKLHAVAKFKERKLKMPVYLVGTCGEEVGMFGAKYLIKSGSLNPKFVVVGEPSELKLIYAHKAYAIFKIAIGYQLIDRDARGFNRRVDLHSLGKGSHSSYPELGVNAIAQALEFLRNAADNGFEMRFTRIEGGDSVNKVPDRALAEFYLTSHQFEDFKRFFRERVRASGQDKAFRVELGGLGDMGVRFLPDALFPCLGEVTGFFKDLAQDLQVKRDSTFAPAYSTVSLGKLHQSVGGVEIHYDLRLLPDETPAEIEKRIQKGVQEIAARYPALNVAVTRERMNPGLGMTTEHELVRVCSEALQAAGISPVLDKKATSTEAAQYFQAGYEAVVVGPGKSAGNSHSPNEHNLVDHLEKSVSFYERLIERVCT